MLERHAVQELLRAGLTARAIAKQFGVSRRTVERIRNEEAVTAADVAERLIDSTVGRPRVDDALRLCVREWLDAERELPTGESFENRMRWEDCDATATRRFQRR